MRFETDVLTLAPKSDSDLAHYSGDMKPQKKNFACRDELLDAGWLLPGRQGARVVLVFSTTRVPGASTCMGFRLAFAGSIARNKAGLNHIGRLWWWPETVTGPK